MMNDTDRGGLLILIKNNEFVDIVDVLIDKTESYYFVSKELIIKL